MNTIPTPPKGFGPPFRGPLKHLASHQTAMDLATLDLDNTWSIPARGSAHSYYALRTGSELEAANRPKSSKLPYQITSLDISTTCAECGVVEESTVKIESGETDYELAIHLDLEDRNWTNELCPDCHNKLRGLI